MTKMANNLMNKFFARFSGEYESRARVCAIKPRDAPRIDERACKFVSTMIQKNELDIIRKFVKKSFR